jgi:hypothetical protein
MTSKSPISLPNDAPLIEEDGDEDGLPSLVE